LLLHGLYWQTVFRFLRRAFARTETAVPPLPILSLAVLSGWFSLGHPHPLLNPRG
jgi:hypothetical protein